MKHGLFLPPTGALSDPRRFAKLAVAAEAAGWDGVFLWDHVLRVDAPEIADAWTTLAAIACETSDIRLGPMVTPLPRRRVQTVIRQSVSLDHLSDGRLTLGIGIGVDSTGEMTKFDEELNTVRRGDHLDEAVAVLTQALSGEVVTLKGEHVYVDSVTFVPTALQQPRYPIWSASRGLARRPIRRAATLDGMFIIEVTPQQLEDSVGYARELRNGTLEGFDVAALILPDSDLDVLSVEGVTWAMHGRYPGASLEEIQTLMCRPPLEALANH